MANRINERNSGNWTLDGEPKRRRTKKPDKALSEEQNTLLSQVICRVLDSLECDPDGKGQLSPESRWVDGGRFVIAMSGAQRDQLYAILEKVSQAE